MYVHIAIFISRNQEMKTHNYAAYQILIMQNSSSGQVHYRIQQLVIEEALLLLFLHLSPFSAQTLSIMSTH